LGAGWGHSYNISLFVSPVNGSVVVKEASGGSLTFTPQGSGAYGAATPGCFDSLAQDPDGSFILTRKNGNKLAFSQAGSLLSVTDNNGNIQTLVYSATGDLTTLIDSVGRVFALSYDGAHRLIRLEDPSGRTVSYSYDSNDNLTSFTDSGGGVTTYTYDSAHRMATAVDPRGVTYLQNTFDSNGRVIAQKNANANVTQFAYSTPS
jgi:YD repeat-containing protein